MSEVCDECGNHGLEVAVIEGCEVLECSLCGAVHGAAEVVAVVADARDASERGIHRAVYPAVKFVERLPGLKVSRADAGDPRAPTWPFVQMVPTRPDAALRSLDNLVRSLALSAVGDEVHWVLEVEFQNQLVFTLKPRFHRKPEEIGSDRVDAARRSLMRVCANLERDQRLSWWRHPMAP